MVWRTVSPAITIDLLAFLELLPGQSTPLALNLKKLEKVLLLVAKSDQTIRQPFHYFCMA